LLFSKLKPSIPDFEFRKLSLKPDAELNCDSCTKKQSPKKRIASKPEVEARTIERESWEAESILAIGKHDSKKG